MDVTGDAVMTTWTRTSEGRLHHLVGSMTPGIKAVLKEKEGQRGGADEVSHRGPGFNHNVRCFPDIVQL